jgi:hypothetical protein
LKAGAAGIRAPVQVLPGNHHVNEPMAPDMVPDSRARRA